VPKANRSPCRAGAGGSDEGTGTRAGYGTPRPGGAAQTGQTAHIGHWLYRNIVEPGELPLLRPRAQTRAGLRAYRHDRRWDGPRRAVQDWIGGRPDAPPARLPGRGSE
jgi:hypothetical protein